MSPGGPWGPTRYCGWAKEVGALYWRLVDEGAGPEEAAEKVKQKFLGEICAPEKETYFYVGTAQVSIETGQLQSSAATSPAPVGSLRSVAPPSSSRVLAPGQVVSVIGRAGRRGRRGRRSPSRGGPVAFRVRVRNPVHEHVHVHKHALAEVRECIRHAFRKGVVFSEVHVRNP